MASRCLILDLETWPAPGVGAPPILALGALRVDTGQELERKLGAQQDRAALDPVLAQLDALAAGADCVVGHNLIAHDLPILAATAPQLRLLQLPVIDTLRLSPLAFPQNPYHRLIKDYKLLSGGLNSPLADCRATLMLLEDQRAAFAQLAAGRPTDMHAIQALVAPRRGPGLGDFLAQVTGRDAPDRKELFGLVVAALRIDDPGAGSDAGADGAPAPLKVCSTRLKTLLAGDLADPALHWPIAYALSWLRVAGGNSVLGAWVRHQFPDVPRLVAELRNQPCGDSNCGYCAGTHDPRRELKRFFGFDDFRAEPPNPGGGSLQADVVLAGMRSQNVLAVLPTGGGKSLCYQLPALNRNWRDGSLTIVISPLQSLMKDQVDGLAAKNVLCAATLNGLLTPTERADVLEQIEMGDVGLLFVAPEQFRSRSFKSAIRHRQIGAWVFDEAHCVSRWGHDFRPDYLYAARFIREFTGEHPISPIGCFTATAKLEVLADIRDHFKRELGVDFQAFLAEPKRDNLQFEVMPTPQGEKWSRCHELLTHDLEGGAGGAIVFVARRKSAEELAEFLKRQRWDCEPFHAGLLPQTKKDRQDAFIRGGLRVIVATNAFGMGVDKPDVRLVIHAEIPGSLENYLQEAGRAGRDQQAARCVLLYDPDDIETQFGISERSKLSQKDIAQILRKLRFVASRRGSAPVVITAGEILADEDVETSFAPEDRDADTKVATAVAWLERAKLLARNENRTSVYPARLQIKTVEEAEQRLDSAELPARRKAQYLTVLGVLFGARADERISTDDLLLATGLEVDEVEQILRGLEHLKLLVNDTRITMYVHAGVVGASAGRFERSVRLEIALLDLLRVLAPDADQGGSQRLDLRGLTTELKDTVRPGPLSLEVLRLIRALSQDHDADRESRSHFELKQQGRETIALRIRGGNSWGDLAASAARRRTFADKLLAFLLAKLAPGQKGKDLLVETTLGELIGVIDSDIDLSAQVRPENRAAWVQRVLLYLHREEVLVLNHGMTVMRRAMTIEVNAQEKRRYVRDDFSPLAEHYKERRIQVHVMREYAEVAVKQLAAAIRLVGDYFSLPESDFLKRYFADKKEVLDLATSEASWRSIVDGLNPVQRRIVEDRSDANHLVLAGPGSGKTRVIVHRVAWLLRVQRVPASSIIVLAFNRHAASQVRERLAELVGHDAIGLTVLTYHAMAMRLMGVRFSRGGDVAEGELDKIIQDAVALLEGGGAIAGGSDGAADDDLRDRLLQGYRYILVDEYQDIDQWQYRLVSALSGRRAEQDDKLTILAVGDDDQNVYQWRRPPTSNRYIQQFMTDYQAETFYLVENYRSSAAIIAAANAVIAGHESRLKREHPIRIDSARELDAPGGHWEVLDPQRGGKLLRLGLPSADRAEGNLQCQAVMNEFTRLMALDAASDWPYAAVLARRHDELQPFVAWCRQRGVPFVLSADEKNRPPPTRDRNFVRAVDALRAAPEDELRIEQALALIHAQDLEPQWLLHFAAAADELRAEFGDLSLPAAMLIDWLYDHAREARRVGSRGLFLGTVHAAKGLEFKHVAVLGDWSDRSDAERRLFYVAMTRAKETLTLCEFDGAAHPFARSAFASGQGLVQRVDLPRDPALATRYRRLSLAEVDLGFAGKQPAGAPIHAALEQLRAGDPLRMQSHGAGGIEFCTEAGVPVAKTSRKFVAQFTPERAEVAAMQVRDVGQEEEGWRASRKVERWLVAVPLLVGPANKAKTPVS